MYQNKPQVKEAVQAALQPMDLDVLLGSLGFGLAASMLIQWHYRGFGSSLSNRREFSRSFPMVMMTTILVIAIVKQSWELGLGLVGALSIVRFRTPIKEPEELAYLFLTIGMGIGFGAGMWKQTAWAGAAILVATGILSWTRRSRRARGVFLSVEWATANGRDAPLQDLTRIIGTHARDNDLRRVDRQGDRLDATFFVDVPDMEGLSDLLADLQKGCPGANVTVIDQNRLPSV